jgi:hypothetical protein
MITSDGVEYDIYFTEYDFCPVLPFSKVADMDALTGTLNYQTSINQSINQSINIG